MSPSRPRTHPGLPSRTRRLLAGAALGLVLALPLSCRDRHSEPFPGLVNLAGQPVLPFSDGTSGVAPGSSQAPGTAGLAQSTKAFVFIFVGSDCPISNKYAPELARLQARYASRGVRFQIVYPGDTGTPAELQKHGKDYGYTGEAWRDPKLALARLAGVRVTPEAALFRPNGTLAYRGRIDDRFSALNAERPAPGRRDLEEALNEVLAGTPVSQPRLPAVGCFIPGLR